MKDPEYRAKKNRISREYSRGKRREAKERLAGFSPSQKLKAMWHLSMAYLRDPKNKPRKRDYIYGKGKGYHEPIRTPKKMKKIFFE